MVTHRLSRCRALGSGPGGPPAPIGRPAVRLANSVPQPYPTGAPSFWRRGFQLNPHTAPPLPLLGDRYRIERELGHGATATVYLAADLRHGRQVAIKVLRPELALAIGPERFMRETRIVAR